jgi:hypothetical protein
MGKNVSLLAVLFLALVGCTNLERTVDRWHGIDMDAWDQAMCTEESLAKGACAPKPGVFPTAPPR